MSITKYGRIWDSHWTHTELSGSTVLYVSHLVSESSSCYLSPIPGFGATELLYLAAVVIDLGRVPACHCAPMCNLQATETVTGTVTTPSW